MMLALLLAGVVEHFRNTILKSFGVGLDHYLPALHISYSLFQKITIEKRND